MELRELRKEKNLTQKQCAEYLGIPLRTYVRYEADKSKRQTIKYRYIAEKIEMYGTVDENHGILSISEIQRICEQVFSAYPIEFCYLFGSYASATATENSDIDLLVCTAVTGLQFYELVETLRTNLKKKVDVLDTRQLENNSALTNEILKSGIKIYG